MIFNVIMSDHVPPHEGRFARGRLPGLVLLLILASAGRAGWMVLAQPPTPEPQTGAHCACAGGICPLAPDRRACSSVASASAGTFTIQ